LWVVPGEEERSKGKIHSKPLSRGDVWGRGRGICSKIKLGAEKMSG